MHCYVDVARVTGRGSLVKNCKLDIDASFAVQVLIASSGITISAKYEKVYRSIIDSFLLPNERSVDLGLRMRWVLPWSALLTLCLAAVTVTAQFTATPSDLIIDPDHPEVNTTANCGYPGASLLEWRHNNVTISPTNPNYNITSNTADFSILSINSPNHTVHSGEYECVATTGGANVAVGFTVNVKFIGSVIGIKLIKDNCTDIIYKGAVISLQCFPPSGYPEVTVSWHKNDVKIRQGNFERITFSQSKTLLTIVNVNNSDSGDYHCEAKNSDLDSGGIVISDKIHIGVNVLPIEYDLRIENDESILYAKDGGQATITCKIKPFPPTESVRFYFGQVPITSGVNGYVLVVNNCSFDLIITGINAMRAGTYHCKLDVEGFDVMPQTRNIEIARINTEYTVMVSPLSVIGVGRMVTMECVAVGDPGNVDANTNLVWQYKNEDGVTTALLSDEERVIVNGGMVFIMETRVEDSGEYICEATNPLVVNPVTAAAQFRVEAQPSVYIQPSDAKVRLGTSFTLTCVSASTHNPTFQWYLKESPITNNSDMLIEHFGSSSNLTIVSLTEQDIGEYSCKVIDDIHLLVSTNTIVSETDDLYFLGDQMRMNVKVPTGDRMVLDCPIRSGVGDISVSWFKGNRQLANLTDGVTIECHVSGSSVLTIAQVALASESNYSCIAEDEVDRIVFQFQVIITVPGMIVDSSSAVVNGTVGQRIQFDCFITGKPTPTVDWLPVSKLADDHVVNLGNGSLVINPLALEHAGMYICALKEGDVREFRLNVSPMADSEDKDKFTIGDLTEDESILVISVGGVVFLLFLLTAVILFLLCCHRACRHRRNTYDISTNGEVGDFKRQPSLRKDNSGVLTQSASPQKFFGTTLEMSPSPENAYFYRYTNPPSLPLTPYGQGSIMSESIARSLTPPAPSPIPHTGTITTASLFSAEDQTSIATSLPNFPRANLDLGDVMGEGEFGPVVLGVASNIVPSEERTLVAVKVLLMQGDDQFHPELALGDFASQMKLEYANVAGILGMCSDMEPFYIIYEYLDQGDLKKFLMNARPTEEEPPKLTQQNLQRITLQVADGMAYLFSQRIIHGDLATRNCLISSDLKVKIADLGIGHDLYGGDYYDNGAQLLPIRWMPPELLVCSEEGPNFSLHSDIWSFGVLCWEVFTFARLPFEELSDQEVLEEVPQGVTLPVPIEGCPPSLYATMQDCWNECPEERPRFAKLCVALIDLELD